MCWDIVDESKLSCGCIVITYEHDSFPSRKEDINYCDKCKAEMGKQEEKRYKDMNDKIAIFAEAAEILQYQNVPIKYLKNNFNQVVRLGFNYVLNRNHDICKKLKVEKIKNRLYCCKNRVDIFVELGLHTYFNIDKTF